MYLVALTFRLLPPDHRKKMIAVDQRLLVRDLPQSQHTPALSALDSLALAQPYRLSSLPYRQIAADQIDQTAK